MDVSVLSGIKKMRSAEQYADTVALALLMYDYILTLHLEIKLVWFSPWNYTKILFLLTRYTPMLEAWLLVYIEIFPYLSDSTCISLKPAVFWLNLVGAQSGMAIQTIRTWAVWGPKLGLGIVLALLNVTVFIISCVVIVQSSKAIQAAGPLYPGFEGCVFLDNGTPVSFWICYVSYAVVEGVLLVLMSISAFRAYRSHHSTKLVNVVHRDGILFYIYLLSLSIANLVCIYVVSGRKTFFFTKDTRLVSMDMLILPESVMYSILTTRIIFDIRSAIRLPGNVTDLHTTLPVEFSPPSDGSEADSDWTLHRLPSADSHHMLDISLHSMN